MNLINSTRKIRKIKLHGSDCSQIGCRLRTSGEITPCNNRDGRRLLPGQKTVGPKNIKINSVKFPAKNRTNQLPQFRVIYSGTDCTSRSAIGLLHSLQTKQSGCQFFPKQLKNRPYPRGCLHPAQPPVALGLPQHHPTQESSQKLQEDSSYK